MHSGFCLSSTGRAVRQEEFATPGCPECPYVTGKNGVAHELRASFYVGRASLRRAEGVPLRGDGVAFTIWRASLHEGTALASRGEGVPSRGEGVPSRGEAWLHEVRASLRGVDSDPFPGKRVPLHEGDSVPSRDEGVASRGDGVPSRGRAWLRGGRRRPSRGTASLHEGPASLHEGTASLHEGTASRHEGTASLHEGTASLLEGAASLHEGSAPRSYPALPVAL